MDTTSSTWLARITRTFSDGKWRALDTMSMRAVLGALQAIAATTIECELSREFGVQWIPRADGRGNEIQGVTQAQMDAYSTRTVQVREKERELAQAWERKHGRAPPSRGGGTSPSAATWPASRPRCRTRAAPARSRASIALAGRRPDRLRARPKH